MKVGDLVIHISDWNRMGFRYCGTVVGVKQHGEPRPRDAITVLWHSGLSVSPMNHRREELEVYSEAKTKNNK